MKNVFKTALLSAAVFAASQSYAQEHHEPVTRKIGHAASDVGHATVTAAKDVGHKTSELTAKGAAAVTDKKYRDKGGPHGEDVYYDSHSRYFYVDKHGHRNYLSKRELRDKPYR